MSTGYRMYDSQGGRNVLDTDLEPRQTYYTLLLYSSYIFQPAIFRFFINITAMWYAGTSQDAIRRFLEQWHHWLPGTINSDCQFSKANKLLFEPFNGLRIFVGNKNT